MLEHFSAFSSRHPATWATSRFIRVVPSFGPRISELKPCSSVLKFSSWLENDGQPLNRHVTKTTFIISIDYSFSFFLMGALIFACTRTPSWLNPGLLTDIDVIVNSSAFPFLYKNNFKNLCTTI